MTVAAVTLVGDQQSREVGADRRRLAGREPVDLVEHRQGHGVVTRQEADELVVQPRVGVLLRGRSPRRRRRPAPTLVPPPVGGSSHASRSREDRAAPGRRADRRGQPAPSRGRRAGRRRAASRAARPHRSRPRRRPRGRRVVGRLAPMVATGEPTSAFEHRRLAAPGRSREGHDRVVTGDLRALPRLVDHAPGPVGAGGGRARPHPPAAPSTGPRFVERGSDAEMSGAARRAARTPRDA